MRYPARKVFTIVEHNAFGVSLLSVKILVIHQTDILVHILHNCNAAPMSGNDGCFWPPQRLQTTNHRAIRGTGKESVVHQGHAPVKSYVFSMRTAHPRRELHMWSVPNGQRVEGLARLTVWVQPHSALVTKEQHTNPITYESPSFLLVNERLHVWILSILLQNLVPKKLIHPRNIHPLHTLAPRALAVRNRLRPNPYLKNSARDAHESNS